MRQGLDAVQATGAQLERPRYLALLAETHGKVGQVEEGLNLLDEATAVMRKTGSATTKRSCIGSRASLRCQSSVKRLG